MGWKPTIYVFSGNGSLTSVIKPAGIEASTGILRAAFFKDPTDPRWKDDLEMNEWREYARQHTPEADLSDYLNSSALHLRRFSNRCSASAATTCRGRIS